MIKKLTAETFAEIASNGLPVSLHGRHVSEYIDDLKYFVTSLNNNMWISDDITNACTIAYAGQDILNVIYENGKSHFLLEDETLGDHDHKLSIGIIINAVYMHSVAWCAINNGGQIVDSKIPERFKPWPL